MSGKLSALKALVCDVFGTLVDWRGSIIGAGRQFGRTQKIEIDWQAFADAWRDARAGLKAPQRERSIATLSNGNVALLANMARAGSLPWICADDCVDLARQLGTRA